MDYFNDLALAWGDEYPRCRARIDTRFENICSLQLSLGGPLSFSVNHANPYQTAGPLFFWHHPSLNYQYECVGRKSWHHLWVSFRGPRALRLIEHGFMPLSSTGFFVPNETKWAAQTMRELISLCRAIEKNQARATLLLEELLLWAKGEIEEAAPYQPETVQKIHQIAEKIRLRPNRRFNFHRAAAEAGMSFSHFRALFRKTYGDSPLAYALQRLMEQAAADLARTPLTIGQIGTRAGYPDPSQFSKAFKKNMGLSPEAFRKGASSKD